MTAGTSLLAGCFLAKRFLQSCLIFAALTGDRVTIIASEFKMNQEILEHAMVLELTFLGECKGPDYQTK